MDDLLRLKQLSIEMKLMRRCAAMATQEQLTDGGGEDDALVEEFRTESLLNKLRGGLVVNNWQGTKERSGGVRGANKGLGGSSKFHF